MCRKFCVVVPVSCGVFPALLCFRPVSCVRAVLLHVRSRPVCPHAVHTFPCRVMCVPVEETIPVPCRVCVPVEASIPVPRCVFVSCFVVSCVVSLSTDHETVVGAN